MQYFKGDATEIKMDAAGAGTMSDLSFQKDLFLAGAYTCSELGDILWEDNRTPLSKAIKQSIFRDSFNEIFQAFTVAGTFESYISVFKKIFGDTVSITFTVPAAGKLTIAIVASGLELSNLVARSIVSNVYVYDELVDRSARNIVTQTVKGFQSQYELTQMLYEMVPAGIFTTITLTVG